MSQLSQIFKDIADAIRSKTGSTDTLTPPQMANAISSIPSGGGTLVYNRFPEINGFTVLPKDTPIIISSYGDDKGLLYVDADGTSTLNNIVYTVYDVRGYDGSFLGYIGTLDSSIIINAQTIGRIEMEF